MNTRYFEITFTFLSYSSWSITTILILVFVPVLNHSANASIAQSIRRRLPRQSSFKPVGKSRTAVSPSLASRFPRITSLDLARHLDRAIATVDKRLNTDEVNIYKNGNCLDKFQEFQTLV